MTNNKKEAMEAEIINDKSSFTADSGDRAGIFFGLLLVVLGFMFIAESFTSINLWQYFWPSLLIVFGLSVIIKSFNRK